MSGSNSTCTPFQNAFEAFIDDLLANPNKHRTRFLTECLGKSTGLNPETAASLIEDAEKKGQKTSKHTIRRIVRPVVDVLKAYDKIIGSLGKLHRNALVSTGGMRFPGLTYLTAQADPMPTALIWGALKVVIDVSTISLVTSKLLNYLGLGSLFATFRDY